ncbi:TolC family protein [Arundinibacter roseus]|uniref:TolC family protein n=1 Tax=Arundinibacter roseus TaxID=2070510 RepID=A0A4R4JY18_9BACT|nr:TolC family protein [Arundinibacter roseus]TDB59797.1 hypothetical protein EZE20_21815 [Arundinibacter roseus]
MSNRCKKNLCVLGLLLFWGAPLHAQETLADEMSMPFMERLIGIAKTNYPTAKRYQENVTMANQLLKKARLSYFDLLSFSYLFSPTQTIAAVNPSFLNGYQFAIFINIGAILQKPYVIRQANSEFKIAQYDQDAYLLNLEAEVKRRYIQYIQRRSVYRLKSAAFLDVESMLKEIKYKYQNGTETLENYNKVLLMLSDHTQGKLAAESEMLIAQSDLEELIGQKLATIR